MMEKLVRYTTKNEDGSYSYDKNLVDEAMDRLGGYEDTGLTPEEIHKLIKRCNTAVELWSNTAKANCELEVEKDYWEREAKKHCAELGEIKIFNMLMPIKDWGEDYGDCLWWRFPVEEPPYCGNPLDSEWQDNNYDDYYTHFTRLAIPQLDS